jgi:hypothetical protein
MEGVDYAADHPSPSGLFAAGKRFVVRYGGAGGSWKHINRAEADALRSAGLWLVANVEGSASGLLGGFDAGKEWARLAEAHFRALGMPADRPIYLSVDFDVSAGQWPAVAASLRGAADVLGPERVGVYGSYDCVRWAARDGVARWFWQTYAWSGGNWHAGNHIEQYRNHIALAGGIVDLCRSRQADFGQWGQEDDVTPEDITRIAQASAEAVWARREVNAAKAPTTTRLADFIRWTDVHHINTRAHTTAAVAPVLAEVTALRGIVEQLAATIAAGGGSVDTAAILAGVDERLAVVRADFRDAVADLGEGGAAQVRD